MKTFDIRQLSNHDGNVTVKRESDTHCLQTLSFLLKCANTTATTMTGTSNNKQLLDEIFVISGIIKVEVSLPRSRF